MRAPIDVLYTPGAREIRAYCQALAQAFGLAMLRITMRLARPVA
jgi:hypothetical protein